MKNTPIILSSLALIGVLVLFGMHFSGDKCMSGRNSAGPSSTPVAATGRIAYVNIDTLEEHYDYLKSKKDEFKKRQADIEAELARSAQQMQNDAAVLQQKYQAGTLTQPEAESAQKRLSQMQESLETRKQALTEQLLKDQDVFNKDLQTRLDKFLGDYNKNKNYDYILSYSKGGGAILYSNKQLDITEDVIKGMNELTKESTEDATKKK